jgi:hypothetical protein
MNEQRRTFENGERHDFGVMRSHTPANFTGLPSSRNGAKTWQQTWIMDWRRA